MNTDIIQPEIFSGLHIKAFFTGRHTGSDPAALSRVSGISEELIYMPIQKHTDKIITVADDMDRKIGDAVITSENGILIGVRTADCVPVLLYDRKRNVAAAVHAGWRGTADSILKKTIRHFSEKFFSDPKDILMAIGPAIRWCCYTVGYDVIEAVRAATGDGDYFMTKGDKYCLDLQSANRQQALTAGLLPGNMAVIEECTFCYPEKFFSYRFSKDTAGRQGGFIAIL
ncbi:MAG: peptidoglycan editing factor PgeF [Nitrospiraceae bacterium]|nr:peptidoglycan editing factor PgeF [Nitrospiraceae bacterium]